MRADHGVRCPSCAAVSTPAQVIAACTDSWPNQKWLLFVCPGCGGQAHVEVSNGHLAIGGIDGAPGPCFFATQSIAVRGLRVAATSDGVTVTLDGVRTRVPARP